MLQAFIITLREGVEAALIVGIVLGCLKRTGRQRWNRIVAWGVFAAILASLGAAYLVHRLEVGEDPRIAIDRCGKLQKKMITLAGCVL